MKQWETRNGISVPPQEMGFVLSERRKNTSNHHGHWTGKKFAQSATLLALRDLEFHQYALSNVDHKYIHEHYDPPRMPSEQQAAVEILRAYEMGEQFKIYDRYARRYNLIDIPRDLADGLVATHSLRRIFDMAAD